MKNLSLFFFFYPWSLSLIRVSYKFGLFIKTNGRTLNFQPLPNTTQFLKPYTRIDPSIVSAIFTSKTPVRGVK